jgi:hypothetical protein
LPCWTAFTGQEHRSTARSARGWTCRWAGIGPTRARSLNRLSRNRELGNLHLDPLLTRDGRHDVRAIACVASFGPQTAELATRPRRPAAPVTRWDRWACLRAWASGSSPGPRMKATTSRPAMTNTGASARRPCRSCRRCVAAPRRAGPGLSRPASLSTALATARGEGGEHRAQAKRPPGSLGGG